MVILKSFLLLGNHLQMSNRDGRDRGSKMRVLGLDGFWIMLLVFCLFFSALFGCIPLYLGSLLEIGHAFPETALGWSNILFQGLFIQIAGQGLIIYGLSLIRVQFSSLILLIQPLTAAFLAFLLFQEMFLIQQIFGAIILLIGIYLAGISDQKTIKN